jgi:hypothetical protein
MDANESALSNAHRKQRRRRLWFGVVPGAALLALALAAGWRLEANRRTPPLRIPVPALPSPNAYDQFRAAAAKLEGRRCFFPNSMPNWSPAVETYATYAAAHRDAEPALRALRAALATPYLEPPKRGLAGAGPLPAYARFREMARTMAGDSRYLMASGRPREAADRALDGVEMGVMVQHGSLIAWLVGQAIQAIALRQFADMPPRMSVADLRHAAQRWDVIEAKRVAMVDVMREEGWASLSLQEDALRELDRGSLPARCRAAYAAVAIRPIMLEPADSSGEQAGPSVRERASWALDAARLMLADRRALLLEDQRYHAAVTRAFASPDVAKVRVRTSRLAAMSGAEGFMHDRLRMLDASARAMSALVRTQIALGLYRADHGAFPASLADLAPTSMGRMLDDPFAASPGTPLRYRRTAGGFLLYSLGPDRRDDGGTPQRRPTGQEDPGDLVAGRFWPEGKTYPILGAPAHRP